MIFTSALLVFGAIAFFLSIVFSSSASLPPGAEMLLRSPTPWFLVAPLVAGGLLGLLGLKRRPSIGRGAVVACELLVVAGGLWLFLGMSVLPGHELSVRTGDPFPAYALQDQDEKLHSGPVDGSDNAKLFIFYRGDW